jgi:ABC-type antimicrobial peptide transport system permease subunit
VGTYQYWLMGIALIVSGVGITNAMLISVYERYREIGTMKCLGAMDTHVLSLFFIEACIQGFIGGVAGFIGGIIGSILTTGLTVGFGRMLQVSPIRLLYIFSFSMILSVVLSTMATIYPARRASRLDPVRALSYEL